MKKVSISKKKCRTGIVFLAVLLAFSVSFASCRKKSGGGGDDVKSSACEIKAFTVDGTPWEVTGTSIAHVYPKATSETPLSPVITVSAGATVNPPSGEAQNFFTAQGVTYTVTAEDGVTKKNYTAKAERQTN